MLTAEQFDRLLLTPNDLKKRMKRDFRERVMEEMRKEETQRILAEADAKRNADWAELRNQVVGSET